MDYREMWIALRVHLDCESDMNAEEIGTLMDQMELDKFREEDERSIDGNSEGK